MFKSNYLGLLFIVFSLNSFATISGDSIKIPEDTKVLGSRSSINESILVGSNCTIKGVLKSINGDIVINANSFVKNVETVNGDIYLKNNIVIKNNLISINGRIEAVNSTVNNTVSTVNGDIILNKTVVQKNLTTIYGKVFLTNKSRIKGNLVIDEPQGNLCDKQNIEIVLKGTSIIDGDIIVKGKDVNVKIYMYKGCGIKGSVPSNVKIIELLSNK
jgi:hypothetical protein